MHERMTIALFGLLAAFCAVPALPADSIPGLTEMPNPAEAPNPNDPTVHQVYDAARAGHFDEAKRMITLVIANHPHSSRAHYVAAEIDASMKNYGDARKELKTAEDMEPGLPNADPAAVAALRKEIGAPPPAPVPPAQEGPMHPTTAMAATGAAAAPDAAAAPGAAAAPARKPFPLTILWVIGAVVIFLWLMFRRRSAPAPAYTPYPSAAPGVMPNVVAGGSGIVGGLASGLAVGAGIAAGEELVRGFESHHEAGAGTPGAPITPEPGSAANSDLGGPDFGVTDPGGSWDDSGASSGDDGGGDWT